MNASKNATYTAVGLIVGGFAVIALGWYGAARLDYTQGQIPYLISGGFSGLGLIAAGLTLVLVQESRRERQALEGKLDEVIEATRTSAPVLPVGSTGEPADVDTADLVVLGRTAYHLPTCHLVEGRDDLETTTRTDASFRDLSPCRICSPQPVEVG